ncbi:hypothetical protein C8R46DRAFT_1225832 [Mycena filopes]|nr:hypothetical protein C8R46DRAFT_1225832 [Mycena filopes]
MNELAGNATKQNVGMMWYSGNDDTLTTHWSTEVVIQNTTFKPNGALFGTGGRSPSFATSSSTTGGLAPSTVPRSDYRPSRAYGGGDPGYSGGRGDWITGPTEVRARRRGLRRPWRRGMHMRAAHCIVFRADMREGRLCIHELAAEESAVNYWEKYVHVAHDSSQKAGLAQYATPTL